MERKEIPEKYKNFFKDHKLVYEKTDGTEIVKLKMETSILFELEFIIHGKSLIVLGDMGQAIFGFTEDVSLRDLSENYNCFSYFVEKLKLCEHKKGIFSSTSSLKDLRIKSKKFYSKNKKYLGVEEKKKCAKIYFALKDVIKKSNSDEEYRKLVNPDSGFEIGVTIYLREIADLECYVVHPNIEHYYWGLKFAYEALMSQENRRKK